MISRISSKLVVAITVIAALFWTVALGLVYGLVSATDNVWRWIDGLISLPPELSQWLSGVGVWLAQFGGWLLLVVWSIGLALLLVLALFLRKLISWIPTLRREGALS